MTQTITILPDHWMTTAEVAAALRKSERTVQEMAKDGRLRSKPAGPPHAANARLYDPQDVRKHLPTGPAHQPSPASVAKRESRKQKGEVQKLGHALDVVSMAGQFLAFMKGEHEAEAQRRKWQLEDARDAEKARLEAEQKRLDAERAAAELQAKPWLTLDEAERLFGLPPRTLKQLTSDGAIDSVGSGRHLRIRRASLDAFSAGGKSRAAGR